MKKWKKILLKFGYAVLGLCALAATVWFAPCPIEGNWGDMDRLRGFLRFENGKILIISDWMSPPAWIGTYHKKGLGKYEIKMVWRNQITNRFVRSTFLHINMVDDQWNRVTQAQETSPASIKNCMALQ